MNDIIENSIEDYLNHKSIHYAMTAILDNIITITNCTYGLIGETKNTDDAVPYTRIHAVHGFPDNSPYMTRLNREGYVDLMQPDTLHSRVYQCKKRIVCSDIIAHRGKPLPDDHPQMTNFSLFPLMVQDRIIGVVGLSGDKVNMTSSWADHIESQLKPVTLLLLLFLERQAIESNKIVFLANISRELKLPLNGIISMTKMLRDILVDDEQCDLLDTIVHCNIQLLEIVNDIVDYTNILMNKMDFNYKPFSLKTCIRDIIQALQSKLHTDTSLIMDYNCSTDLIVGDEVRVTQIILNVLNNSVKYTTRGTININIQDDVQPTYTVMQIRITDTGTGLSQPKLKSILDEEFLPNTGEGNQGNQSQGGIGLGLLITKHLIETFGGKFNISSEEGVGTTVTFTLKFDNYVQNYSKRELADYFSTRYILFITDDPAVHLKILSWAEDASIKPIICGTREMQVYLHGSLFDFEAIVIIDDGRNEHSIVEKVELSPHQCLKALICHPGSAAAFGNSKIDYIYSDTDISHALSAFINQVYFIRKLHATLSVVAERTEAVDKIKPTIRILIADTDAGNLSNILHSLGYFNITVANDGLEFYMEIQKNSYDIAFVNLNLPVMSGLSATKKFKEAKEKSEHDTLNSKIVLIAITTSMSESIRRDCYDAGMNGYITKPPNQNELNVILKAMVRKKIQGKLKSI